MDSNKNKNAKQLYRLSNKRKLDHFLDLLPTDKDIDMKSLFFKVWNNKYLMCVIRFHLRIYARVYFKFMHQTIDSLVNFTFRRYITTLELVKDKVNHILPSTTTTPITTAPITTTTITTTEPPNNKLPRGCIPFCVISLRIKRNIDLEVNDIPPNVKYLHFSELFTSPLNIRVIPSGIKTLQLSKHTRIVVPDGFNTHFNNLTKLKISNNSFNLLNHPQLFKNLSSVQVDNYPQGTETNIPSSVKSIVFCNSFNKNFPSTIPNTLESISIGSYSRQKFDLSKLPLGLKEYSNISFYQSNSLKDFSRFSDIELLRFRPVAGESSDITNIYQIFPKIKFLQIGNLKVNL